MQAIILSIGDELVLGQTVDSNSAFLSAQLARLGIGTFYHQTVPDDFSTIVNVIRMACSAADIVIVTGGLGPTEDDLTRQALAEAIGSPLVLDEESLGQLTDFFAQRKRPMAQNNRIQAMRPAEANAIPNTCGTAPGLKAKLGRATIYVTPGVPREMVAMFEKSILPEIETLHPSRGVILTTKINTFGMGESSVGEKLGSLMARARNPKVGTTVAGGIVSVRIRSEFDDARTAQSELDATADEVEKCLGPIVFGRENATLQAALVELLKQKRLTLATAESCTGGLLGQMVTDVPGSSAVYRGGWITYSNEMKQSQLGVSAELLDQHGAVSGEVAQAMARGAMKSSRSDLAAAITGVAGPDGGTPDKPVGTVWVALAYRHDGEIVTDATRLLLPGERDMVRDRTAKSAAQMLRFHVMGVGLEQVTWGQRVTGALSR